MRIIFILCFTIPFVIADDQAATLAERLVSTLPELPSVIRNGFNGETGGFQKMISNVLGDGLISQLVNDPLQVAGQVLPDLNGNTTDSKNPNDLSRNLLRLLTTTSKPSTTKTMLVEGVPVDFDAFIRKNNLEKLGSIFSTKEPIAPSPTPPSAEKIADEVLSKIQRQMGNKEEIKQKIERPASSPRYILPPLNPDPSSMYNMDYIQRFIQSQGNGFGGSPPGFQQTSTYPSLPMMDDPSPSSYQEIRRLKELLSAYEEVIQTKDFFSKRKQLQDLENQLKLHRDRIYEQQQLESTLREKEKELQSKKKEMEQQLHAQLKSWNLTDLPETTTMAVTTRPSTAKPAVIVTESVLLPPTLLQDKPKSYNHEIRVLEEEFEDVRKPVQFATYVPEQTSKDDDRSVDFEIKPAEPIIQTTCDCKKLSMNMLKGEWTIAFATSNLLEKVSEMMSSVTRTKNNSPQVCSSLTFSSSSPRDIREMSVVWNIFKKNSNPLRKINGYIRREDDRTMSVEGADFNEVFGERLCALKTNSVDGKYDYVLFAVVEESCQEVMLLVRNPQQFFNEENNDLTKYLKNKIDNNEIEQMQMTPFTC